LVHLPSKAPARDRSVGGTYVVTVAELWQGWIRLRSGSLLVVFVSMMPAMLGFTTMLTVATAWLAQRAQAACDLPPLNMANSLARIADTKLTLFGKVL